MRKGLAKQQHSSEPPPIALRDVWQPAADAEVCTPSTGSTSNGRARSLGGIRHALPRVKKNIISKNAKTTSRRRKGKRLHGIKGAFKAVEGIQRWRP